MTATATTHLEHDIGSDGLFVLRLRDGHASLRGTDGGTVRVSGDVDLGDAFTIERGDGSLSLRAGHGFELVIGRRRQPRIEVELPRRATVVVEATSADVSADALAGDQRYQTVSGDVRLSSIAGTIAIQAVSGDVGLVASGVLDVAARTVSGDVEIRAGRIARLALGTTSGDVRVAGELAPDATHRIETVSGDMLIAPAGGMRLEATTVAGEVRASVPHRTEGGRGRRVVIIGDGGATLETRSMSGDVGVVEARQMRFGPPGAPEPAVPGSPVEPPPTAATTSAIAAAYDEERLRILRTLERGEIDVAEAGRRLGLLDAGDMPEIDR